MLDADRARELVQYYVARTPDVLLLDFLGEEQTDFVPVTFPDGDAIYTFMMVSRGVIDAVARIFNLPVLLLIPEPHQQGIAVRTIIQTFEPGTVREKGKYEANWIVTDYASSEVRDQEAAKAREKDSHDFIMHLLGLPGIIDLSDHPHQVDHSGYFIYRLLTLA